MTRWQKIRKALAIVLLLVLGSLSWRYLPAMTGATCELCGRPMMEHTVVLSGKSSFDGTTWKHNRCPDGTVWASRPGE